MLKIENVETMNWRAAIRGMRNPMNSWDKSDTISDYSATVIGPNDLDLMERLVKTGTDHSKFLRMVIVSFDVTAPLYWWKEFDTYKIGTVRNSCSTMHRIESRELTIEDFATDGLFAEDVDNLQLTINYINKLIGQYRSEDFPKDSEYKKDLHRRIVKLLPDSYMQRATITTNYQVLRAIRNSQRKNHKLTEWRKDFMEFIDSLPYAKELLICQN